MALSTFLTSAQWSALEQRIGALEYRLSEPIQDNNTRASLQKEHTVLSQALEISKAINSNELEIAGFEKDIAASQHDQEMSDMLREEIASLKSSNEQLSRELEDLVYPDAPENSRSVFLEIRAGTGGLEASLFASEMARMYMLYAEKKRWAVAIMSNAETDIGGCREIVLHIEGKKVYESLRYEAGVHRVQRVPATEGSGRVHTSTVTVAVLPENDAIECVINPADLRIDTYRASGAGGQHVNKTDSAIRITHIPTGTVVTCQDERSQHKNRAQAMKILQARITAAEKEKQNKQVSQMRKEMSASAERADKVRTYNFPQNRVTDHQAEITINRLDFILLGNLDEIIQALVQKSRSERATSPHFSSFMSIS